MTMHKSQIRIVNHDHFAVVAWFGTRIIVRGSKSSNFGRRTFKLKIQLFVFTKNFVKQLVLIAKNILKLDDSKGNTLGGWIITYIRVRDMSWRFAYETKVGEVISFALGLLIFLWAGGVITEEIEIVEGSTRSVYHLLKLLLLVVPETVLLLTLALVAGVVLIVVVVLIGGVDLLPLRAVGDEVGGVIALEEAIGDILFLWNLCKVQNFLTSRAISLSEMLSYCSSETAVKEDKTNSKVDESVVLVGLATWPPTQVLVTKDLLVR
jgi:hypothetical protein